MNTEENNIYNGLREKLNQSEWPGYYMFKFIVPFEKAEELILIFKDIEFTSKPSKNGKYLSVTSKILVSSPEEIIAVYIKASKIEGIISL